VGGNFRALQMKSQHPETGLAPNHVELLGPPERRNRTRFEVKRVGG
jgi:hypothetical protein